MQRTPAPILREDWGRDPFIECFAQARVGTDTAVLFYLSDQLGASPQLLVHDYDEIFIIHQGRALFITGDRTPKA